MLQALASRSCKETVTLTKMMCLQQGPIMAGVPGAVLVTFQGCGHLAPFQEPDKFVALVDSFLEAQGSFQPEAASAYTCQGLGLPDKTTR